MTPSNATTITRDARLKVLPRLFKDVLLLVETEKENRKIPKMMQALSQAARSPEPHFKIMTVERYLTYLRQSAGITGSDSDPLRRLIIRKFPKMDWETGSRNNSCSKDLKIQPQHLRSTGPRYSRAETRKGKIRTQNYWRQKIQRRFKPSGYHQQTQEQNNTNIYFTSYTPVPPSMLNKIVGYNSSIS